MKILLTGGGGMVGQNLLEHPLRAEHHILAPTRSDLDLRDKEQVSNYLSLNRPDMIIHAAGKVGGIQANIANPYGFFVENACMGINIVECAVNAGVPRFLNLASSCIYPKDMVGRLSEINILGGFPEPTNEGYALAKIAILRMCQYTSQSFPKLQYKSIIPCNLYGRHDNFDPETSHLVPSVIHKVSVAIQNGDQEIQIWGDGNARREFMYAADLAGLIMRCVAKFDALPDIMNVGVGKDNSILEYYQIVAEVLGWNGRFIFDHSRPVGMKAKLLDTTRQKEFGFQPETSLTEGISLTHRFYQGENYLEK